MTTQPHFVVSVSHTPWVPERVTSWARLREKLYGVGTDAMIRDRSFHLETDRAPNHVWSLNMWKRALERAEHINASHALFLQDDVELLEAPWGALERMVQAVPDQVIGLETAAPAARYLAEEGYRWCTTSEGLIGVGYILPREVLAEFLQWRETELEPGAISRGTEDGGVVTRITEDTLIALFCLATGRRIYHPIPTIIDHDTTLPSTYGNDAHSNRRPSVPPRLDAWDSAEWHEPPKIVPHLGRFYGDAVVQLARRWVKGFDETRFRHAMADDGHVEHRRITYAKWARGERPSMKIMIGTPFRGGVHRSYVRTIVTLMRDAQTDVLCPWELDELVEQESDVVLARSRLARMFLESDATHLFFIDADVEFLPMLLRGMLAANRDFVAVPYPRRDELNFDYAADATLRARHELGDVSVQTLGRRAQANAYRYTIRWLNGVGARGLRPDQLDAQGCLEIAAIGFGCVLLTRAGLERVMRAYEYDDTDLEAMADVSSAGEAELVSRIKELCLEVEHWRAGHMGLRFEDVVRGKRAPTTALFQTAIREGEYLSEDLAFCMRWRDAGERIWLYLGPGSPATHWGEHAYVGMVESFGLSRTPPARRPQSNVQAADMSSSKDGTP